MYNHIKWNYGVTGYLSEKEKQICNEIDALASSIIAKGKDISVVISIEGGNQFHIKRDTGSLIGYMNAEQCWYALKGIMTSLLYMER